VIRSLTVSTSRSRNVAAVQPGQWNHLILHKWSADRRRAATGWRAARPSRARSAPSAADPPAGAARSRWRQRSSVKQSNSSREVDCTYFKLASEITCRPARFDAALDGVAPIPPLLIADVDETQVDQPHTTIRPRRAQLDPD